MPALNFTMPYRPAFDSNAIPIPGAMAYFSYTGTTTPAPIYTDVGLSIPASNPLEANGAGRFAQTFLDDSITYRLRIFRPGDNPAVATPVEEYDPYEGRESGAVGPRGPNGYSVQTLSQLKAAPTTDSPLSYDEAVFTFKTDQNYTTLWDDDTYIESDEGGTGAWVRQTDKTITTQDERFTNAPALALRKWVEGGVVNAKQQALPANFVHEADDAWQYLQNLAADMEAVGSRNTILLPTADTYLMSEQLVFGANKGSGIMGLGPAKPILSWIGDTLNPVTQDNASGAMITWQGFDHAWGGIKDIVLFANRKAVHCLYVEGDITPGFKMKDVHGQHALLDIFSIGTAGYSATPVNMVIESPTAYPYIAEGFGGISAVCGRSVLRFRMNGSVGLITVRDANLDNGAFSFIDIDCPGDLAGIDYVFESCRFEQNMADGDIVTLKYADGASQPGTLTFRNPKHAAGAGGSSTANFVRNRSTSPLRPDIQLDPFLTNDAIDNVYKDDFDAGKSVPYVQAEHFRRSFTIEHSRVPTAGTFPSIARPKGLLPPIDMGAGTTVTVNDHDKLFTNLGAVGTSTFNLPSLATVGVGFRVRFSVQSGFTMTVEPNGSDLINGLNNLTNSASRDALIIEKSGLGEWTVISRIGTWA